MSRGSITKRGEIWLVNLDPTLGSEIKKKRPCAIIGVEHLMRNEMTISVPITSWKPKYSKCIWMINIAAGDVSGLDIESAADASQIRAISTKRFIHCMGRLSNPQLQNTVAAVVLCIGFEP